MEEKETCKGKEGVVNGKEREGGREGGKQQKTNWRCEVGPGWNYLPSFDHGGRDERHNNGEVCSLSSWPLKAAVESQLAAHYYV